MKTLKRLNIFLLISGSIGVIIGGSMLFAPIAFLKSSGITIENEVNLLSELRAHGGTLLVAGIFIIIGVFYSRFKESAILLSTIFYLSYGVSRLFAMSLDGIPNNSILIATIFELSIGIISVFILFKHLNKKEEID